MRRPLLAGNWKMFKGPEAARSFARELLDGLPRPCPAELLLCPPAATIPALAAALVGSPVAVGAQNCHWEAEGAFTGEVSAPILAEAGCRFVLVGHSERRQLFGETDDSVRRKLAAVLAAGMTPLVCVGETLEERERGFTEAILERQVRSALAGLEPDRAAALVLAYEPVWAIGTGRNATPEQAQAAHAFIRGLAARLAGAPAAAGLRVVYGGSVKPANAAALLGQSDVDGALVGGASLEAGAFLRILDAVDTGRAEC